MDVIDDMTREEQMRVKEEAQRLLRSIDLSHSTTYAGEARLDFYPAEIHGSARKRTAKRKAELFTDYDEIGLTSQLSTAKGGRPKVEIRATKDINAFALVAVDDGDSLYYTARILSEAKPVDIKLDELEASINIHIVEPSAFLSRLEQVLTESRVTTWAASGVKSLRGHGAGETGEDHVRILFASTWSLYQNLKLLYDLRALGVEEILCKECYAKNVFSFFEQSFLYLFIFISMLGHVHVAAHVVRTRSSGPYPRFAAFETFRILYQFVASIYYSYTLPHSWRMALTPALFKMLVTGHFYNVSVVLLLLWDAKHNAGYKGLLRNAFAALLISILMTSSYFYWLSALYETLIPGLDFQEYYDVERGFIDATEGLRERLQAIMLQDKLERTDL